MESKYDRCNKLVAAIQGLGETEIDELFKILHENSCEYSRNNNGVFVNLSWLPDHILDTIEQFVNFCAKSKNELEHFESLRQLLNSNVREKSVTRKPYEHTQTPIERHLCASSNISLFNQQYNSEKKCNKVTSTMKFYLLKKKFMKQSCNNYHMQSDLVHEPYTISQ